MLLSIIIPTFNRRKFLERALNSVINQSGDFEIIVVDDAGVDDTPKFMQTLANNQKIVFLRKEKNGGVNSARNLAISRAKGEWVAGLDDDDEFVPNAVEIISSKIKELPLDYNVAYFNSIINTDTTQYVGGFQFDDKTSFYDPSYEDTMTKFNLKGDCKPVFRKSLFAGKKYIFPELVNGFESYLMNLLAKDNKGIRYFKDISTIVHFNNEIKHISHTAPRKNPLPLFILHSRQILQHYGFYLKNPSRLLNKLLTMVKLLLRYFFNFFFSC